MTGKQLVRPTGAPPPRGTSPAQGWGCSCSLPGSRTEAQEPKEAASFLSEAWGSVQSHPGRPVSLGALSLPFSGQSKELQGFAGQGVETAAG